MFRTFTVQCIYFVIKTTVEEFHDIAKNSEMDMLFSKQLSAEDKLHKYGFSLKIVLKID